MNIKDVRTIRIAACIEQSRGMIPSDQKNDVIAALEADARALWAVRVLDAWAAHTSHSCARWIVQCASVITLHVADHRKSVTDYTGPTPDAARIAAATALVAADPTLDPDGR